MIVRSIVRCRTFRTRFGCVVYTLIALGVACSFLIVRSTGVYRMIAAWAIVAESDTAPSLAVHVRTSGVSEALKPTFPEPSAEAPLALVRFAVLGAPRLVSLVQQLRRDLGLRMDHTPVLKERGQGVHLGPVARGGGGHLLRFTQ